MQAQSWLALRYIHHTIALPGGVWLSAAIRLERITHPNTTGLVVKRTTNMELWPNDGDEVFLDDVQTTDSTTQAEIFQYRVFFVIDPHGWDRGHINLCYDNGNQFTYYSWDSGLTWTQRTSL